jgi:NAD(P)-dependent dehydrogenase (short-subunit alcohol dehydrogenase family)
MRQVGKGRIINVSSVAGRVSVVGGGAYHASKFALEAVTDALRPEVAPFGVAVVNVAPGPTDNLGSFLIDNDRRKTCTTKFMDPEACSRPKSCP